LKSIKKHVQATSHTKAEKQLQKQLAQRVAGQAEGPERDNLPNMNMNDNTEAFSLGTIQRSALPAYLHWLCDRDLDYIRKRKIPSRRQYVSSDTVADTR
jgi:hypothetical protein